MARIFVSEVDGNHPRHNVSLDVALPKFKVLQFRPIASRWWTIHKNPRHAFGLPNRARLLMWVVSVAMKKLGHNKRLPVWRMADGVQPHNGAHKFAAKLTKGQRMSLVEVWLIFQEYLGMPVSTKKTEKTEDINKFAVAQFSRRKSSFRPW